MRLRTVFARVLAVAAALALPVLPALAQSTGPDPLALAGNDVVTIYGDALRIVYIVGGLGIIVLAVFAFFGKFRWMWFWALAGGIFLVASSSTLISWLGGNASGIGGYGQ